MKPQIHHLKINPKFFKDVKFGEKTFEVRKHDRNFKIGDTIFLNESYAGEYTGNQIKVLIHYILEHEKFPEGIQPGYCVLGISL